MFGRLTPRIALLAALVVLAAAGTAQAYQPAAGWTASDYVTGFTFGQGLGGPGGLAFDGRGNLFVAGMASSTLHKVPPGGGTATATRIGSYRGTAGVAFDKSGRLYMAGGYSGHNIVEIDPSNGDVIRTVVDGLPCPVGLAVDPISGDLFVSNVFCAGGGIMRITGFQNGRGTARRYAGTQDADGIAFGSDGTMYAAGGSTLMRIGGTNSSAPGAVSVLAYVPKVDGIAYADATADSPAFLMAVRNDGEIDRVDLDGRITPVLTGGSRGDLVTVGPDQCMYADLQDRVIKVGPASGNCAFSAPVGPGGGGGGGGGANPSQPAARGVDTAVSATARKQVRRGRRFTVTVKVTNVGTSLAHRPIVTYTVPRGTQFVRVRRSDRGVTCKRHKRTLSCQRSSLAAGKSFSVRVLLKAVRGSTYTNRARVRSRDLDPQPGNNAAVLRTRVMRR